MIAVRFPTITNGYSPEDVERYIEEQAAMYTGISNENRQLKDALQKYELKLREIAAAYTQLKEQGDADRLRLAEVMMQANKTAADLVEKAQADIKIKMDEANKEADRIKAEAAKDAAELREKLDAKFNGMHDIFSQITDANETARQNLLTLFLQVDQDARQASSLLHTWTRENKLAAARAAEMASAMPPEQGREWLDMMGELLKDVQPPTKVGRNNPYSDVIEG